MKCPKCGTESLGSVAFCQKCGASLDGSAAPADVTARMPANPGGSRLKTAVETARGSADAKEEEIWKGSYSAKAMIGTWIASAIISVAAIVLTALFAPSPELYWPFVIGAIVLLWFVELCVLLYRRMSVGYRLTNHRFFHESGILRRTTDRIEVIDMDDITFEQGIVERMTGVGTIRVTSSDRSHPELLLPGIDDVRNVSETFDNLRRQERMRRGLHIESI